MAEAREQLLPLASAVADGLVSAMEPLKPWSFGLTLVTAVGSSTSALAGGALPQGKSRSLLFCSLSL